MLDDYPNNSAAFMEDIPEERKEDEDREKARINTSIPVIKEVVQWFDSEIKAADSIKATRVVMDKYKVSLEDASLAYEIVHDLLELKLRQFETDFSDHLQTEE